MLQLLLAARINSLNLHLQFWLELAENSIDLVPPPLMSSIPLAPSVNESESYYSSYHPQASLSLRQALSFYSAALYAIE
jgi:hypothetical protein